MADTNTAPEDLGAPQSFLVLADGTAVYDRAGDKAGTVDHVLTDDNDEIFQGLVIKAGDGHRFAAAPLVDGIFEHGVIIAQPASQLPQPSENATDDDSSVADSLRRAWNWLIQPK